MKGMVFTEFFEMVETRFSAAMVDRIIEASAVASGGVYTSVGTYDNAEMGALVRALAEATGVPAADLLRDYGEYLFPRFVEMFPHFFDGIDSAFAFMHRVDSYIHVEVRKLYPDAELPQVVCQDQGPGQLLVEYRSARRLGDLAEGLIRGCIRHFNEEVRITRADDQSDGGRTVHFTLTTAVAAA